MAQPLNQKVTNPDGTISYFSGATPQDVNNSINSSILQQQSPINVTQPENTPLYPTASLSQTNTTSSATPPLTATPQETQQSDLSKQIASLLGQDSAKTAFQTEQYNKLGFGMTYDAQGNIIPDAGTADLQAKQTALTNEALAIPQQLQLGATGLGVTAGGLQPMQTAALRNNAIQALGVGALIAAKNGQLTTAQHYVDNATIQKFGPIEAQIAALTKNLELIKNDPATTLADKNRAQAQLDIQNKKLADVAQQKADYTAAQAEALKYATVADAQTLSLMQKAANPIEVAQIAASKGLQPATTQPASVQEYQFAKSQGYTGSFSDYQNEDANRKRSIAAAGAVSNQTIDNERALFNQFNGEPIVKDYNTILAKKQSVDAILSSKLGGPGDLAVVYEFMKGLDPTSVVRETEYASAAASGNIFAGAFAKFNGYLKPEGGFLPDSVKSSFQSIVNSKLKVQQQLYDNVKSQYESVASRQGLNPSNVVIDYGAANKNTYTPGSTIHNGGILYLVGADGESITPIGNYSGT